MPRSQIQRPRRYGAVYLLADDGSIALIALVLLGLVGFCYRMLGPDGWLGGALEYLWSKSPGLVWLAGFGIVLVGAMARSIFFPRRDTSYHSDLLLYVGVALGLFFLVRLVAIGSL
jgi:hypothetical protein